MYTQTSSALYSLAGRGGQEKTWSNWLGINNLAIQKFWTITLDNDKPVVTVDSMNNSNSVSFKNGLKYLTDCTFCFEYNQIVKRTRTQCILSFSTWVQLMPFWRGLREQCFGTRKKAAHKEKWRSVDPESVKLPWARFQSCILALLHLLLII